MFYVNIILRVQNFVMGYFVKKDVVIYVFELGVLVYVYIFFKELNVYGQYINFFKDKDYI